MKKLTLLVALTITLVAKADMSDYGCGWRFRGNFVRYHDGKNNSDVEIARNEFYWNGDCNKLMKFVRSDGKIDYFYINSDDKMMEGKDNDGVPYKAFFIYSKKTHDLFVFQILYDDEAVYVKLIEKTGEYLIFR
jgi:hypothetical protein